jgi:hypothetical protein
MMKAIQLLILVSFITGSVAFIWAEEVFTPEGQVWEDIPSGHDVGKDNGIISGSSGIEGLHFQGADCGICHTPGGPAGAYVFTVAGTIYKDKAGRETLEGAEVVLRDVEGNVLSMTTNSAGNFFTYSPVAYDPALGDDTPRNQRYKAWVDYGDSARAMVTLAYVGATPTFIPRMSCNMHHNGRLGARGALTAGKFDTLPNYPEYDISYNGHVLPILKNRCKACHVPSETDPTTAYGDTVFDYSGGLDLSAYTTSEGMGLTDVVNVINPELSLILAKPANGSLHGGGSFWNPGDKEYDLIKLWISEGAFNN